MSSEYTFGRGYNDLKAFDSWSAPTEPLGFLTADFIGAEVVVHGGPYDVADRDMYGVKLDMKSDVDSDFEIPCPDFGTPNRETFYRVMVDVVAASIWSDVPIYVGCGWGRGRTGMFIAAACHLMGIKNPIQYTRDNYSSLAVETKAQEAYAVSFNPRRFRWDVMSRIEVFGGFDDKWKKSLTVRERLTLKAIRLLRGAS